MNTLTRSFGGAFLYGMAQAFDLGGALASRRLAHLRQRTVRQALASDCAAVGRDLAIAMRRYQEAHER
jgi:hypothetical protein